MFEDVVQVLDAEGLSFTEDYEGGIVTVDIADIDKAALVGAIQAINNLGVSFEIDDVTITITGLESAEIVPEDEALVEGDAQAAAFADFGLE